MSYRINAITSDQEAEAMVASDSFDAIAEDSSEGAFPDGTSFELSVASLICSAGGVDRG